MPASLPGSRNSDGDHEWTIAILAGGRATRFGGRNKAGLRLGRDTFLDRQLAIARVLARRTIVIANDPRPFQAADVSIVADIAPGTGALGGLYTALAATRSARTLVLACDMPFVTASFLTYLMACGEGVDIAIPRTGRGYEPLCATYSRSCLGMLHRRVKAGQLKISDAIADAQTLVVREIGPDEIAQQGELPTLFSNINTPDDYARALELHNF
jgi:molybdopterin-guanine dinucleotide biosynthesis protein A